MEMKQYKVALIGFGHMHINDVAAHFYEHSQIQLVACADTEPAVPEIKAGAPYTRAWNKRFAVEHFGVKPYDSYIEMLDAERPELCVVTSENGRHAEITEACASRGVDVCIEKPMAVSLSEGLRMARAARRYGTRLLVNWPMTWNRGMHKAAQLIAEGAIGRVIEIKTRMGHTGPLGLGAAHRGVTETAAPMTETEKAATWWHQAGQGGGAMRDYCCYGAMLDRWFTGNRAQAVMGMRINADTLEGDAEDNAAMLVRFENAFAVNEATWTTHDHMFKNPVIYGTQGAIVCDYKTGKVEISLRGESERREVPTDPAPECLRDIACAYVHHRETGEPLHLTLQPEFNLDCLAILDAGLRSADSGHIELVRNACWQIG